MEENIPMQQQGDDEYTKFENTVEPLLSKQQQPTNNLEGQLVVQVPSVGKLKPEIGQGYQKFKGTSFLGVIFFVVGIGLILGGILTFGITCCIGVPFLFIALLFKNRDVTFYDEQRAIVVESRLPIFQMVTGTEIFQFDDVQDFQIKMNYYVNMNRSPSAKVVALLRNGESVTVGPIETIYSATAYAERLKSFLVEKMR